VATAAPTVGAERATLIDSIEAMLRPLMPLVLNYGVTYADAQEVLRALFVETMSERIREQGREPSMGRIAVMAGINRGEVAKLTSDREQRELARAKRMGHADDVAKLLSGWHEDPRFNTPYGAPLDLSLAKEEGFKTFDDLIAVVCPGTDRELLLDEMVTANCVEIHSGKFVRCTTRTFVVSTNDLAAVSRIGRQAAAFNATCVHNLLKTEEEPSYFARDAYSALPVSVDFRGKTLEYLREHGQKFIENCDRWITESEQIHLDASGKRVGVAVYFFEESADRN
jgi:hypothetical protein